MVTEISRPPGQSQAGHLVSRQSAYVMGRGSNTAVFAVGRADADATRVAGRAAGDNEQIDCRCHAIIIRRARMLGRPSLGHPAWDTSP
jgi:hypothetical protein